MIRQRLEEHYPHTPVPLDHRDPFTLLVAVLLSAQCTDRKVNEVTPALFAAGPDPVAMAALPEETILGHIRQLGLAQTKARNVRRLAELLIELHGSGELIVTPFPEERRKIDIGDYYSCYSRFHEACGWQPSRSLRHTLERTLAYYQQHGAHYL